MVDRDDWIQGALAYIDGAIELWPKVRREARLASFRHPMRMIVDAGEFIALMWLLMIMVPAVWIAVILNGSAFVCFAVTLLAMVGGWGLYCWTRFDSVSTPGQYRHLFGQEVEQVDRFFLQAQRSGADGNLICWEEGRPHSKNLQGTLRVLEKTRLKLEWLKRQT